MTDGLSRRLSWGKERVDVVVLFPELVLFLIRQVRAGLVVLEIADEFHVDTDRAGDNVHGVLVSVPVLLVQTTEALAMVLQEPRIRTREFSVVIRLVAKAKARATASGRPSRTATTTKVTETIRICVKAIPSLPGVLERGL